jgi:hypothetical protein
MRASPRGAIRNQVSVISSRQLSPWVERERNPPIRMLGFALVAPEKIAAFAQLRLRARALEGGSRSAWGP